MPFSWDIVRIVVPHFVGGPVSWYPPPVSAHSVVVVLEVQSGFKIMSRNGRKWLKMDKKNYLIKNYYFLEKNFRKFF